MGTPFDQRKQHIVNGLNQQVYQDRSPKGSVDVAILPLIEIINQHINYVTTSSCSGRISVFHQCGDGDDEGGVGDDTISSDYNNNAADSGDGNAESNGSTGGSTSGAREVIPPKDRWVFVSHDMVPDEHTAASELYNKLQNMKLNTQFGKKQSVIFRYEPFILHVEARDTSAAQAFVAVAVRGGLRLSGMVPGRRHIIVSVRSSLIMDCPLWIDGDTVVDEKYIEILFRQANEKFNLNTKHMNKYQSMVSEFYASQGKNENKSQYEKRTYNNNNNNDENNNGNKNKSGGIDMDLWSGEIFNDENK